MVVEVAGFEDVVRDIKALVREALRRGEAEKEIYETLFEDVTVNSDQEYKELVDEDIPSALRKALEKVGLICTIYHKREAISGYEYLANCVTKTGRKMALGFDVDIREFESIGAGEVELLVGYAARDTEWSPSRLVYYHEV